MGDVIQVLICDDDALVRRGLNAYVSSAADMHVVAAVSTCDQVQQALATAPVDVLLLDVQMPGTSGPELVRLLADQLSSVQVIYLTSFPDERLTAQTMTRTVAGFLTKDVEPDTLLHAIRAARHGLTILAPDAPIAGLGASKREPISVAPRERDILAYLCEGRSNSEIAHAMYLSESSIKATLATLMTRFHVTNRVSLALAAVDAGII